MAAGWNGAVAWTLIRWAPEGVERGSRWVGWVFGVDALGGVGVLGFKLLHANALGAETLSRLAGFQFLVGLVLGILEVMGFVLLLSQRLLGHIQECARRDGLTEVLNRRALDEEAPRVLDMCRRQGMPCTLAMIDLDHFKRLNDTLGHAAGDAAVRHTANVLLRELRKADLLGRYGGEEFCVLMPGTPLAQARVVAERLLSAVAGEPLRWEGQDVPITFSLGLAGWEGVGAPSYEELQGRADQCLYRAKALGRNRVEMETAPQPAG